MGKEIESAEILVAYNALRRQLDNRVGCEVVLIGMTLILYLIILIR